MDIPSAKELGTAWGRAFGWGAHEHRAAGILNELIQDHLIIIVFAGFKTGEGTDADDIAVATHHRDGFQQMLALVPIHHHAVAGFQFPGALVHIQHNHVHSQVLGRFLGAEAGAEAVIEKHQQGGLVPAQLLVGKAVRLHGGRSGQGVLEAAQLLYTGKMLHFVRSFQA